MAKREIFDYDDYRAYLLDWIAEKPKNGRGIRAALAKATHSPISHISQVLKGISHFTMEQAEDANDFLGHPAEQADYFLCLVQLQRAGTSKLRERIKSRIKQIRKNRALLRERFKTTDAISSENQSRFYSSWIYSAVHILLTIDQFQTPESISKYFGFSARRTNEILEFLKKTGLVIQEKNRFKVGATSIHLGSDSATISQHHRNWRVRAMQCLDKDDPEQNLHYSSVVSLSKTDISRIRSILIESIEKSKAVIRASPAEKLYSLCFDFFET